MTVADDIPGLGAKSERPRLNRGADFIRHPLTPTDGFVLSRVDGVTSYEQLCAMTGLGTEATLDILRRLKKDGLILGAAQNTGEIPAFSAPAPAPASPAPASAPATPAPVSAPAVAAAPVIAVPAHAPPPAAAVPSAVPAPPTRAAPAESRPVGSLLERLDDGSPVDEAALAPGPDLSRELKVRLLRVRRQLKTLSPHELLGVPEGVDRAVAKRAYFAASKEFHPDRFYGKDIGSFREVLGDIFTHLTRALQTIQGGRGGADKK